MVNDAAAGIMGKVAQTCDAICLKYESGQYQHGLFSPGDAGRIREAIITVARCRGLLHGIARHDDSKHSRPHHRQGARRCPAQHESCAIKLRVEPGGVYPHQRLDGRLLRHAPGLFVRDWTFHPGSLLCGISSNIHVLVACRIVQGCGGAMMVPVGRLTLVRTFPNHAHNFSRLAPAACRARTRRVT